MIEKYLKIFQKIVWKYSIYLGSKQIGNTGSFYLFDLYELYFFFAKIDERRKKKSDDY